MLVEIQKIPYYFPAERASCYSADLLLRQYSRVKTEKGAAFSYTDLRKVYTIVFYEKSVDEFKKYPKNRLIGWLSFFCTENAEEAEALCRDYPWLSELYAEMAEFGRRPEELVTMFSGMLREMDRNTIRYMVDDMKEQIEKGKAENAELKEEIARLRALLESREVSSEK